MESYDAIHELRQARAALYEAVVTLPFDLAEPLPSDAGTDAAEAAEVAFVDRSRAWYNNAVRAFNAAVFALDGPPIGEDGPPPGHFRPKWIVGEPTFGLGADVPPPIGFASASLMGSFETRAAREAKAWQRAQARHDADDPWPAPGRLVLDQQARRLVLDLRRRAMALCKWLDDAVVQLETAFWPRVTVAATEGKHGRHAVTVEMLGNQTESTIPGAVFLALRELATGKPYRFNDRKAVSRFNEALPELAPHLQTVKGRPLDRALPAVICSRITFVG